MNQPTLQGYSLSPLEAVGRFSGAVDLGRTAHAPQVLSSANDWLARAKDALYRHFEAILVVVLLASLLFIHSFVVHKFAFLLFYFIPVLLAGFYLGTRHAVTTALLATGLVAYIRLVDPFGTTPEAAAPDFWNLLIWVCFLTLTGIIVGRLQEANLAHKRQLWEAYVGIIQILTKYLDAADAYTKSHSERVAAVSALLAQRLGGTSEAVRTVWTAALLHDIGKVEVIDLIRKAAALDPHEKAKVDRHTQLGAQILLTTGTVLKDAIPLVEEHHRSYDNGGDAIPLGARIIAVADTYDAVICDRPYRAGRLHWQALQILEEGAGRQFDPAVVAALRDIETQVQAVYQER